MKKQWVSLIVVVVLGITMVAGLVTPGNIAQAQTDERCFPETGQCISGPIRAYWEANGGLPVFGFPITEQRQETIEGWTGPVQWFERDRLEDHGDQGVLAGRLGATMLEHRGTPWESYPRVEGAPEGCRFFPETGHSLCAPFLAFWENRGGLERFGYPITEPMQETIGDWTGTVQYFERRRIEHHADNQPPFDVLLGLLGREVLDIMGGAPAPQPAPQPEPQPQPEPAPQPGTPEGWQQFTSEGGRFSVLMPGTPTEQVQTQNTALGDINVVIYQAIKDNSMLYQVAYSDYPQELVDLFEDKNAMLQENIDLAFSNMNGTIDQMQDVPLQGHPGKEIIGQVEIEGNRYFVKWRFYLVGNRLYQVMAMDMTNTMPMEEVDMFLNSFTLATP